MKIDILTRLFHVAGALLLFGAGIASLVGAPVTLNWEFVLAIFAGALVISIPYIRGKLSASGLEFAPKDQPVEQIVRDDLKNSPLGPGRRKSLSFFGLDQFSKVAQPKPVAKAEKLAITDEAATTTKNSASSYVSRKVLSRPGRTLDETDDPYVVASGMLERLAYAAGVEKGRGGLDTFSNIVGTGLLTQDEQARLFLIASETQVRLQSNQFMMPGAANDLRYSIGIIIKRIAVKRLTSEIKTAAARSGRTLELQALIGSGNKGRRADVSVDNAIIEIIPIVFAHDLGLAHDAERFLEVVTTENKVPVVALATAFPPPKEITDSNTAYIWLEGDELKGNPTAGNVMPWLFDRT